MTHEELIGYHLASLENAEVQYNPETEACVFVMHAPDGEDQERPVMDVLSALGQDTRFLLALSQRLQKELSVQSLQVGLLHKQQKDLMDTAQRTMTTDQWVAFCQELITCG